MQLKVKLDKILHISKKKYNTECLILNTSNPFFKNLKKKKLSKYSTLFGFSKKFLDY